MRIDGKKGAVQSFLKALSRAQDSELWRFGVEVRCFSVAARTRLDNTQLKSALTKHFRLCSPLLRVRCNSAGLTRPSPHSPRWPPCSAAGTRPSSHPTATNPPGLAQLLHRRGPRVHGRQRLRLQLRGALRAVLPRPAHLLGRRHQRAPLPRWKNRNESRGDLSTQLPDLPETFSQPRH